MENWLLQHWYGEHRPPWYLRALEPVYRSIFNYVQRKGGNEAAGEHGKLPLIVVGNITVGGTGKTPLVMHLCRLAADMGLRPGIASTGYRRQGSETCLVDPDSDPRSCGDEPVLLAKRTGAPVVVAKRRADAIAKLQEMGLDLVISDDGLQHADLGPDVEICVIDGARGIGNGHLLPAGPLREPASRLEKVDYVVTNGTWPARPGSQDAFAMQLSPGELKSLDDRFYLTADQFRQKYSGIIIHAIAAIGNPQRFFNTLEALEITARPHVFPDHHAYRAEDFGSIPAGQAIIMTEKDAVKCRTLGLADAWCLPVEAQLPEAFDRSFKEKLDQLVEIQK